MSKTISVIIILIVLLPVVGCGSPQEPTPMTESTLTSTPTPRPISTKTLTNVPTATSMSQDVEVENKITFGRYIYRVTAADCANQPKERVLTGVRIKDYIGIITALHGVLDCNIINAFSENADHGKEAFNNMKVSRLDISHDIALIVPVGNTMDLSEGLNTRISSNPHISCDSIDSIPIRILGYPKKFEKLMKSEEGELSCAPQLKDRLPDSIVKEQIEERGSPELGIRILDIRADVVSGHSGAPIIDISTGQLWGIVIGRLPDTIDNGWGIPWREVNLKSIEMVDKGYINELAAREISSALTAFYGISDDPFVIGDTLKLQSAEGISLVIEDQMWTSEQELILRQIKLTDSPVWLIIYMQGSDSREGYLNKMLLHPDHTTQNIRVTFLPEERNKFEEKICKEGGQVILEAKLYREQTLPAEFDIDDELIEFQPELSTTPYFRVFVAPGYCQNLK